MIEARRVALELATDLKVSWNDKHRNMDIVNQKTDNLVSFLLESFVGVPTDDQVRKVFLMKRVDYDSIPATVFPLAVMKDILMVGKVDFNRHAVPSFVAFIDRYRPYLKEIYVEMSPTRAA